MDQPLIGALLELKMNAQTHPIPLKFRQGYKWEKWPTIEYVGHTVRYSIEEVTPQGWYHHLLITSKDKDKPFLSVEAFNQILAGLGLPITRAKTLAPDPTGALHVFRFESHEVPLAPQ